jgi:hypothetical protein
MKTVTFGLLFAASASCGLSVNAQTAKEYCEELYDYRMESYPETMPTRECIAGNDDTYTLTCEDGCDSCDANKTCGVRSVSEVIDSQGGSTKRQDVSRLPLVLLRVMLFATKQLKKAASPPQLCNGRSSL